MSSTYGEHLKLSIFGQSHAPAIGMTLDGVPAGRAIDLDELQRFLDRRGRQSRRRGGQRQRGRLQKRRRGFRLCLCGRRGGKRRICGKLREHGRCFRRASAG